MKGEDSFLLRWTEYQSTLSGSFRKLREESELYDVSLGCSDKQGRSIQAHKLILSACSRFFKNFFSQRASNQNSIGNPFIFLRGVSYSELSSIIDYMYDGQVYVNQSGLSSFLALAHELQILGLYDHYNDKDKSIGDNLNDLEENSSDERNKNKDYLDIEKIIGESKIKDTEIKQRFSSIKSDLDVKLPVGNNVNLDDRYEIKASECKRASNDLIKFYSHSAGKENMFTNGTDKGRIPISDHLDEINHKYKDKGKNKVRVKRKRKLRESGSMSKWKSSYDTGRKYKQSWEQRLSWVEKANDATENAFCKTCKATIFPKISSLINHERSQKHIENKH